MPTQVYSSSSSSLPSKLSNKYVSFSSVANAVTSTTTSYVSPSTYNNDNNINDVSNDEYMDVFDSTDITKTTTSSPRSLFHNGDSFTAIYELNANAIAYSMNTAKHSAIINAESSADMTKSTISYVSPSNDIDTKSSAVSVVEETTLAYDLSNNIPSSFNYNNDLHFDLVLYLVFVEILLYNQQNVFSYSTVTLKTYDTVYDLYFDATFGTPFHIIDHGSVLYLNLIQILLYDQQNVISCAAVTTDMTCNTAVFVITEISSGINDEDSFTFTIVTTAIITMTTVFHESPSAIHDEMPFAVKDEISSVAVADGAQYDYYYGDTAVSIASPSIIAVSIVSTSIVIDPESSIVIDTEFSTVSAAYNKDSSAGNDSAVSVAIKVTFTAVTIMTTVFDGHTCDNDFDLYFNTIFDTSSLV